MPFRACHMSPTGAVRLDLDRDAVRSALESREGLLWVDIEGTTEEDGRFLEEVFHFHPLQVEDCISPQVHPPKADEFDDHLFLIVHGINYAVETEVVTTAELAIFLGQRFVVSNHNYPLYNLDSVWRQTERDGRPLRRGAAFLAHALLDSLVDNVLPTIDRMGEVMDEIEDQVVREPHQAVQEELLRLKRSVLQVHRVMAPQRELLNRLSRGEFSIIQEDARLFYRDVYDHLVRIEDLSQAIRERADFAVSFYLSAVANRQNETMKLLSMVATIFMPLTLLAGIYGMNFENMPELRWQWGYFAVLGFMLAVIALAVWWFWARRLMTVGRRRIARARLFAVEPKKIIGWVGRRLL